jgi:hypothetical protein
MIRRAALKILRSLTGWPPQPMPKDEKRALIRALAKLRPGAVLVETGTFRGDTVEALRNDFPKLITIELFEPLHAAAREKFRDDPRIEPLLGSSEALLPSVIRDIASPIVYWLDGHYSGPGTARGNICPVLGELEAIFARNNPDDIILIDDARLFGWRAGYPSKKTLRSRVAASRPGAAMQLVKDIIVIIRAGDAAAAASSLK